MADNAPQSVRIRTGEGNEYRLDAIDRAAERYDRNRSDAVACACDDAVRLLDAIEDVLGRTDLTHNQREEIAARFDRAVSVDIEVDLLTRVCDE
ncbi:DUF7692 domain-containing protein [Haloarcula amylovorans]|uniref:DUF7692 domain-containing protein n=1 Tax=Haloarcula amylovorans TaxID=2562280 RepID=UPI0010766A7F|nr:hypothetical protein [Halomicroarcula amylolytica]